MRWSAAVVLTLALLNPVAAQVFDFDQAPLGKLPPGWREVNVNPGYPGNWVVMANLGAPSGSQVLAKMTTRGASLGQPEAILEQPAFRDGEVGVQLETMGSLGDEVAGVLWRYRDEANFYELSVNVTTGTVSAYRIERGQRTMLGSVEAAAMLRGGGADDPSDWIRVRVEFNGPALVAHVNGHKALELKDTTPGWPGNAGLWTNPSTLSLFDNFEVKNQDRP
jgi:hypothetical protein